ncbi:MAG: hypothetical protein KDG89_16710 [Geminicoccaceae bacterium]|nr:hypothetical protein [Geminicoccaceae bacterium]
MAPRRRLEAELRWLPELEPRRATELLERLRADLRYQPELLEGVPGLARANLAAHFCHSVAASAALEPLLAVQAALSPEALADRPGAARRRAGMPPVDRQALPLSLGGLREARGAAAARALQGADDQAGLVAHLATRFRTQPPACRGLLEDLVRRFTRRAEPELDRLEAEAERLLERLRPGGDRDEPLDRLAVCLRGWDRPAQLLDETRGLDEDRSRRLFRLVRGTAVDLANDDSDYAAALRLTELAKGMFKELPEASRLIEEDYKAVRRLHAEAEMPSFVKGFSRFPRRRFRVGRDSHRQYPPREVHRGGADCDRQ